MRLTPARRATSVIVVRRTPTASTHACTASSSASSSTVRCDTLPPLVPITMLAMRRIGLAAVRYGIPLAMTVAGIACLAVGGDAAGAGVVLIGSAGIVLLVNVLFRLSLVSNEERE